MRESTGIVAGVLVELERDLGADLAVGQRGPGFMSSTMPIAEAALAHVVAGQQVRAVGHLEVELRVGTNGRPLFAL